MSSTVFSLEQYNLLIKSEEPKKVEAYGNLFEILSTLNAVKAVSLEDLNKGDELTRAAASYNKDVLLGNSIKEWYIKSGKEVALKKKEKCELCNTSIVYPCYIENQVNGNVLMVGSTCINKFPAMKGYIDFNKNLYQMNLERKKAKRRIEFYSQFPDCDNFISNAENYFNFLPVLLPYNLYSRLEQNINNLRNIKSIYINEGKTPFKSPMNSFQLFEFTMDKFNKLVHLSNEFVLKNQEHPLICRRREIDWLLSRKNKSGLYKIAKNNGIYTFDTLKFMYSIEFIKDHFDLFFVNNLCTFLKFDKFTDDGLLFSFCRQGYSLPILFKVSLTKFMYNVGPRCILDSNFKIEDKNIINIANVLDFNKTMTCILNYSSSIIKKLGYILLFDDTRNFLVLYRQKDKAIKELNSSVFLSDYKKYFLLTDNDLKKYYISIIENNIRWISYEEQRKFGTNDKVKKILNG